MDMPLIIADLRQYGWELTAGAPGSGSGDGPGPDALETQLAQKINELIQRDFGALVQLLYRVDVSERRLRQLLDERSDEDAGVLIARLIIERQWQKIESRRRYRRDDNADVGVDRW